VATPRDVVVGLHLLLASSPARLLAVSLPDLVGDRAPQNQPGTNREYPNWCVPLADVAGNPIAMEDLPAVVEERMITPIRDRAD
jgi:4-alpha-glucanotransferase